MTNQNKDIDSWEEDLNIKLYNFGRLSDRQELSDKQEQIIEWIKSNMVSKVEMREWVEKNSYVTDTGLFLKYKDIISKLNENV